MMWFRGLLVAFCAMTMACGDDGSTDGSDAMGSDAAMPTTDGGGPVDAGPPPTPQAPGSACTCDAECEGDDAHPGICVYGICMQRAAAACAEGGSTGECNAGSRCWGLSGSEDSVCWPDCDSFTCEGACDDDGSCVFTESSSCDPMCGSICGVGACSPEEPTGTCPDGETCVGGACEATCSPSAPTGSCPEGSTCTDGECVFESGCPDWRCTGSDCTELIPMPGSYARTSPEAIADGYYIATLERYAYLRRDLTMLVRHAACEVARRYPDTDPIGLADLAQADGMTPGVDTGSPRHPTSTHRGSDLDIAYYQTDGSNDPQIICGDGSDDNGNGVEGTYNDGYFCTTEENIIDWPRQAYWFAKLATTPLVRVFGIDETLADDFQRELDALLEEGAITSDEHSRALSLGWGNDGGWAFHHHHTHNSYSLP